MTHSTKASWRQSLETLNARQARIRHMHGDYRHSSLSRVLNTREQILELTTVTFSPHATISHTPTTGATPNRLLIFRAGPHLTARILSGDHEAHGQLPCLHIHADDGQLERAITLGFELQIRQKDRTTES